MTSITDTFLQCCFRLLNVQQVDGEKARDLATVIHTLDLNAANLSVGVIFVYKYQHNSINSLAFDKSDSLPYLITIASLILSNKYLNDQSYTLKTWQSVLNKYSKFDISLGMLNQLEQNVLVSMDYVVSVRHNPQIWDSFAGLAYDHISTLRYHVALVPGSPTQKYDEHGIMNSPPPTALNTSPMTYASNGSYNSTPNTAGPVTPVSLPGCALGTHAFYQMYTSPSQLMSNHYPPQHGATGAAGPAWDFASHQYMSHPKHVPSHMDPDPSVHSGPFYGYS